MTRDLDAEAIRELLQELGERLAQRGLRADFYIVGGAAMLLAYGREQLARNIDAIFEPKAEVYAEAKAMAAEHKWLDGDWLNDGVKGFVNGPDPVPDQVQVILSTGNLSVQVASPKRLLAMKVAAARAERDIDDIVTLAKVLEVRSIQEILDIASAEYGDRLEPRSKFVVMEALEGILPQHSP